MRSTIVWPGALSRIVLIACAASIQVVAHQSVTPGKAADGGRDIKLFIASLAYTTDDRMLEDAFKQYGRIAECRIATNREDGKFQHVCCQKP